LLDQAIGVRKRIDALPRDQRDGKLIALAAEQGWAKDLRRWFGKAQRAVGPYLQEQFHEVLPVLALGLPPDTGKSRHAIALDNGVEWLGKAHEELQSLQGSLGASRQIAATASPPARFEELLGSGLVGDKVIHDHAKAMAAPRTPKQLYDAIGSAKELVEATLRGALDRLGEDSVPRDDLPRLMKRWREAVGKLAPPDPEGEGILDRAQAALANIVTFLAEWRNAYGSGHGRPHYPPGLAKRHARLAADSAETCIRFVVLTMDDLELLAPG
jgi:hypothetical protein